MVKIQRFVQLNKSELQINKIINSEGFGLISLTKSRKGNCKAKSSGTTFNTSRPDPGRKEK